MSLHQTRNPHTQESTAPAGRMITNPLATVGCIIITGFTKTKRGRLVPQNRELIPQKREIERRFGSTHMTCLHECGDESIYESWRKSH